MYSGGDDDILLFCLSQYYLVQNIFLYCVFHPVYVNTFETLHNAFTEVVNISVACLHHL